MDSTPGGFNNVTAAGFESRSRLPMVMGARAHQTALFVICENPFLAAAPPAAYAQRSSAGCCRLLLCMAEVP